MNVDVRELTHFAKEHSCATLAAAATEYRRVNGIDSFRLVTKPISGYIDEVVRLQAELPKCCGLELDLVQDRLKQLGVIIMGHDDAFIV